MGRYPPPDQEQAEPHEALNIGYCLKGGLNYRIQTAHALDRVHLSTRSGWARTDKR
ncbi:hypothetical protein BVI2075_1470005 [Burkholderia vietnamiensis]|nr:hypothetical protein BVI2075_1470005 [Burkholderia vietnamiensis]